MCQTLVPYADGFSPVCPACGYAGPLPPSHAAPVPVRQAPSQAIAIVALVLNLVIWPGLGTMIAGRIGEGLTQGLLFLLAFLLFFTILLIPVSILLWTGMWIWGLVSGIQLIQQANAAQAARPVATV